MDAKDSEESTLKLPLMICFVWMTRITWLRSEWRHRCRQSPYKALATNKTSLMQKEMQEAAEAGFRFSGVMGGDKAFGGSEVLVIMSKAEGERRYEYRLLATSKTSTAQKELQEAGDAGFENKGQTVFKSTFGGKEVIAILERDPAKNSVQRFKYRLVATSKTGTMQKELSEAGDQGFRFVGLRWPRRRWVETRS